MGRRQVRGGTEEAFIRTTDSTLRKCKSFCSKRNKLCDEDEDVDRESTTHERAEEGVRGVLGGTAICVVVGTNLRGWGAAAGENSAPYFPIRRRVPN